MTGVCLTHSAVHPSLRESMTVVNWDQREGKERGGTPPGKDTSEYRSQKG